MLTNRFSESFMQMVHERTIEILSEVGFCVPEPSTLTRLEKAGFPVNHETQMVCVTPDLLEAGLARLPKKTVLYPRSSDGESPMDRGPCFMGAGTPVNVHDLHSGKQRPSTWQDVRNMVKLQDALPQVDIIRPAVTATDLGDCSDLVEIAECLRGTRKPAVHRTLSPDRVETVVEMLAAVAGGEEAFRAHPSFAVVYCPISPVYVTPENIRSMLRWAEYGVPVTILSMAMGGASAPATLLGELIVINADVLSWIVALEILYPGTPLIYGSVSSVLDMRTGLLPLGTPERGMVNAGAAAMARYYGLPSMGGGFSSDAKQLDAQAGFEKAVTAVPLLLEQANIIYGVGSTDAGASISYTQLVLDNELISGLRRMMESIAVHDLDEEMALIKENSPRGNFLSAKHTRRAYRELWQPKILNRDTYDIWRAKGKTIEDNCREKAEEILTNHERPALPVEVEAEMERILRQHLGADFHF